MVQELILGLAAPAVNIDSKSDLREGINKEKCIFWVFVAKSWVPLSPPPIWDIYIWIMFQDFNRRDGRLLGQAQQSLPNRPTYCKFVAGAVRARH